MEPWKLRFSFIKVQAGDSHRGTDIDFQCDFKEERKFMETNFGLFCAGVTQRLQGDGQKILTILTFMDDKQRQLKE